MTALTSRYGAEAVRHATMAQMETQNNQPITRWWPDLRLNARERKSMNNEALKAEMKRLDTLTYGKIPNQWREIIARDNLEREKQKSRNEEILNFFDGVFVGFIAGIIVLMILTK